MELLDFVKIIVVIDILAIRSLKFVNYVIQTVKRNSIKLYFIFINLEIQYK